MKYTTLCYLFLIISLQIPLHAQFPANRIDDVVIIKEGNALERAWDGGYNRPVFFEADLNEDGLEDLILVENTNLTTFAFPYLASDAGYQYTPEMTAVLPPIEIWAVAKDYDGDGLKDIFSFKEFAALPNNYGLAIYKASMETGSLTYDIVVEYLEYEDDAGVMQPFKVNELTPPTIEDVDKNGVLDILLFDESTRYLNHFKNIGNTSNFQYVLWDYCWGDFTIADTSAQIGLGINCDSLGFKPTETESGTAKILHGAATVSLIDVDGDEDCDIIMGVTEDTDIRLLENGGTVSEALMTSVETAYPFNTTLPNAAFLPKAYTVDVNHDNLTDLIIAPSISGSYNVDNLWHYKNIGTEDEAIFEFQTNAFLQEEMIDVGSNSYPVFLDYNGDGLKDLFIGNSRYYPDISIGIGGISKVWLFKNVGTDNFPTFELITDDFANLSQQNFNGIIPAFGDIDNDGDVDMVIGSTTKKLYYFENIADASDTLIFENEPQIIYEDPSNQVIQELAIDLYDYDEDGQLDIVTGLNTGYLHFLQRKLDTSIVHFEQVSSFWGGVAVLKDGTTTGYSIPRIFEDEGTKYLAVKSSRNYVYLYTDLDQENFTLIDSMSLQNDGILGGMSLADLNNDGKPEWILGNFRGGISLFSDTELITNLTEIETKTQQITVFPNPCFSDKMNIDLSGFSANKVSLTLTDIQGKTIYHRTNQVNNKGQMELPIQDHWNGIYFLTIQDVKADFGYTIKCVID